MILAASASLILADTSVWVDHFRRGNRRLTKFLEAGEVGCHPFVIGELACGRLNPRADVLELLERLPRVPAAEHHEVMAFVHARRLAGAGLGWIDMHLLASAVLGGARVWTLDKNLAANAAALGVEAS